MDKKNSTQKKAPLLFFPHSKKRKKKKERKKNVHRAAAAARFFSARQPLVRRQHPVVDHRRGVTSAVRGRDERRDPNRACLRGRLLSLRCSFFFYSGWSLSFGGHKARFAEKSDDDGDQNRDCADSFDDKKNDDDGFAHPIVAEGSTRRHVAGPPSLSLSTGDDDDDVNDESPKSEEKDGTSRVDDFGFCTTGETKRDRGASFRLRRR